MTKRRSYKGENNPNAILTDAQVVKIKAMLNAGYHEHELARQFGVSRSTISHIRLRYIRDTSEDESIEQEEQED